MMTQTSLMSGCESTRLKQPTPKWLLESGTLKAFTMPGGKKRYVSRAEVERLKDGSLRCYKPRGEQG
jgi:hypothetical protein